MKNHKILAYRYKRINGKVTVEIYYIDGSVEILEVDDEGKAMLPKMRQSFGH